MSIALGCTPKPKPSQATAFAVGPDVLVRSYRDSQFGERAYTGYRVRLTLNSGSYAVSGDQLHWYAAPMTPPAIIFKGCKLPADSTKVIVIEGLCEGIVRDGRQRTYGVNYYISVNCSPEALAVASAPHTPPSD
jgi:hypothetical protein